MFDDNIFVLKSIEMLLGCCVIRIPKLKRCPIKREIENATGRQKVLRKASKYCLLPIAVN